MTLGYSSDQIRQAEKPLLDAGVPLMQRAADGLADEIRRVLENRGTTPGVVLVLAGSGDNGGDALYAAARLAATGVRVRILTTGTRWHEDALAAAITAGADAGDRHAEPGTPAFEALLDGADVVVDGILGIGRTDSPALRGRARDVVQAVRPSVLRRMSGAPVVVAVDIPSGIGSDDGAVPDPLVLPALVTVTFGAVKAGLLLPPASGLAGRIHLVEIGLDLDGVDPVVHTD
ncbi:NAD(P)H-hydrate epimerase [Frondihabitans cladoniiphilus]|uniref:NAD(P)H-hydrate epimerase n=1 Tax=Frondihabitans cladoniiphilus TaxID=715785 RepID=A0ABP8W0M3_9MICO